MGDRVWRGNESKDRGNLNTKYYATYSFELPKCSAKETDHAYDEQCDGFCTSPIRSSGVESDQQHHYSGYDEEQSDEIERLHKVLDRGALVGIQFKEEELQRRRRR